MLRKILFVIVFIIALAFLVPCVWRSILQQSDSVRVSGTGSVPIAPDEASVSIGLRSEQVASENLPSVRTSSAATLTAILDRIRGIAPNAEIETSDFNVYRDFEKSTYTLENNVRVTLNDNVSLMGSVIDAAVAGGANNVGSVRFAVSDDAAKKARLEAQKIAVDDTRAKALALAQAGGRSLGRVQSIVEDGTSTPLFLRSADLQQEANGTPIVAPQSIDVVSNIVVEYALQ